MRCKILFIPLALSVVILSSCASKTKDTTAEDTRSLMKQSIELACHYRDSIKLAKDSATVERLMADLDDSMTKLNYQYPADLYINSSENQNEVLADVTARIVELRDSILYGLAHPKVVNDTLHNIE